VTREDNVVPVKHALERARMECDNKSDLVKAIQQDYWVRRRASTTGLQRSLEFDRVLCGCQFTLSMWETDLEWRD
jgi:hypothetical protein